MSANGKSEDLTPKQADFLRYYLNPKSETYSNALQSALKAGYAQEYAENLTSEMPDWLSEYLGDNKLLNKAMSNLQKALADEDKEQTWWKATEFTLKTVGKAKFGNSVDVTSDGKAIQINLVSYGDNNAAV